MNYRIFTYNNQKRSGFTFVEMLAAMIFVAIVIPIAVEGIRVASRVGEVADHKRTGAQLADEMLNELILSGDWAEAETEGDFDDDWPDYRWEIETEEWDEETLQLVTVKVFFTVQGKEYSVALSSLAEAVQ